MKSIARVLVIVACAVMLAVGALSIPVMTASGAKAEPLFGVPTRIPATGTNGQLKDVTCPTATTCIAVGLDGDNQAVSSVGIELGVTWTWSPSREIEPGLRVQTYLFGVACPTATSCVAVGYDGRTNRFTRVPLCHRASGIGLCSASCLPMGQRATISKASAARVRPHAWR